MVYGHIWDMQNFLLWNIPQCHLHMPAILVLPLFAAQVYAYNYMLINLCVYGVCVCTRVCVGGWVCACVGACVALNVYVCT